MKIEVGYPPNIEYIKQALPINETVVFAYGDTIYNPHDLEILPDIEAHEEVHQKQQGIDPQGWWLRYLTDPQFRLDQEIEAFGVQFAYVRARIKDKNLLYRYLFGIAINLSSSIYGNLISHAQAESKIRNHAKTLLP
jgi:hypothetical protein